jgi:membrane carboxypeptidase/penicillin-binding protein
LNTYLLFFLLTHAKCLLFCLFSDNENPRKDAATTPLVDAPTADEPPSREAAMVAKSLEATVKKGTSSRAPKHLKKAPVAGTSHGSTDDVSTTFCGLFFYYLNFSSHVFLFTDFDEEIRLFGH